MTGAAGVLVKMVKCDFKKLGPKFGKQMKSVAAAVAELSQEAIAETGKEREICIGPERYGSRYRDIGCRNYQ